MTERPGEGGSSIEDQSSAGGSAQTASESLEPFTWDTGIPQDVRDHGKVLDPKLLEPGDLLLVCKKQPGRVSRSIQKHQSKLFDDHHARWHHAAVCGGGVEICEALVREGVRASIFWEYMTGEYDLKVRRLMNVPATKRAMVAYHAATQVRTAYGLGTIFKLLHTFNRKNPWRRSLFQSRGVICSQLYFEACMRIGVLLMNLPKDQVSPAHLSASSEMEDVRLRWRPVA